MRFIGIAFLSLASFVLPLFVFAAVPALYAFGGRIAHIQVCNSGILFSVIGPRPGVFMYIWGTPFFLPVNIRPGDAVLGNASPTPAPCVVGFVPTGAGLPVVIGGAASAPSK